MPRQRGSSIQRITLKGGEVRWRIRLDLEPERDDDGRIVRRRQVTRTYRTEAEAQREQSKARAALAEGTFVEPDRATVSDVLDAFIASKGVRWKASTRYTNVSALAPVRAEIGDKLAQKLTAPDVDRLVAALMSSGGRDRGKGRSARSVHIAIQLLNAALKLAVKRGTLARNVADDVELPTVQGTERTTWTAGELRAFIDAAMGDRLAGPLALSTLGMRRGEVLGARWGDVQWDRQVIVVRTSRVLVGDQVVEGSPKSARGRREVPLHGAVVAALRATREATYGAAVPIDLDKRLIAVDELGEPVRPDHYSQRFHALVAEAGLRRIRLHDVRHTVATLLLEAGQPPHVVAAILGHDVRTLLATYAHSNPVSAALAMGALVGVLNGHLESGSDTPGAVRDSAGVAPVAQIGL